MAIGILAQKKVNRIDKNDQKMIKGGSSDYILIEDTTIM